MAQNNQGATTIDVRNEIVIACPRAAVAEYASNPDNAPEWYLNIRHVKWETSRPLQIGSRIAFVARFLGRRIAYTYEVVTWTPGERFVMRTVEGPFPMETTYAWATTADAATRMEVRNRGTPAGLSKLFTPLMASAIRRANRKDLNLLKQLLESGAPPRRG